METGDDDIESDFPNLRRRPAVYELTSPVDDSYNCVAWAANDTERWWWPHVDSYWPEALPRQVTIDNFVSAFAQLGYEHADDEALEPDYEKIALYAKGQTPTHMARQLASGQWTSKLGKDHDISHISLGGVEGYLYGRVVLILKRPRTG